MIWNLENMEIKEVIKSYNLDSLITYIIVRLVRSSDKRISNIWQQDERRQEFIGKRNANINQQWRQSLHMAQHYHRIDFNFTHKSDIHNKQFLGENEKYFSWRIVHGQGHFANNHISTPSSEKQTKGQLVQTTKDSSVYIFNQQ